MPTKRMSKRTQELVDKTIRERLSQPEQRMSLAQTVKNDIRRASRKITHLIKKDPFKNYPDEDAMLRSITEEELESHATEESCWICIYGRVYDATAYLDRHPGGDMPIIEQAGAECTELFERIFHSLGARNALKEFIIGKLEGEELGNLHEESEKKEEAGCSPVTIVLIVLVFLAYLHFRFGYEKVIGVIQPLFDFNPVKADVKEL